MSQLTEAQRRPVLERDGYECRFCGMSEEEHKLEHGKGLSIHHIIKARNGGSSEPENLITVCTGCHKTIESTQADALERIKEMVAEDDNEMDVIGHERRRVIEGEMWEHDDYGTVRIMHVTAELRGWGVDGRIEKPIIQFVKRGSDAEYRESYDVFVERAAREAHQYNDEAFDQITNGIVPSDVPKR